MCRVLQHNPEPMAYARSKKKVAMSQATQATQASASARLSRATARETQAKANITSQVETTCQSAHIELRHYGPSVSTSTCCEESGRFCAGCARATSDGAACRECAGGFIEREGNCIACADSAGWTNLAGKTCPQLAAADCNDIKVRGKSSNEAWGAPKVLVPVSFCRTVTACHCCFARHAARVAAASLAPLPSSTLPCTWSWAALCECCPPSALHHAIPSTRTVNFRTTACRWMVQPGSSRGPREASTRAESRVSASSAR